jgi:hypothetical protein
MGAYRHDLLVAMRVVNKIESEMVHSEWESWLAGETGRCERVRELLARDDSGSGSGEEKGQQVPVQSIIPGSHFGGQGAEGGGGGDENGGGEKQRRAALREWFSEYCGSCAAEQRSVWERTGAGF